MTLSLIVLNLLVLYMVGVWFCMFLFSHRKLLNDDELKASFIMSFLILIPVIRSLFFSKKKQLKESKPFFCRNELLTTKGQCAAPCEDCKQDSKEIKNQFENDSEK